MNSSVSVVFPMYNEEDYVFDTIQKTTAILNSIALEYEIIIVDDGSTDKSALIAEQLIKENKNIRILQHVHNKGIGASLKTGFLNATKDFIMHTDMDQPFDLHELIHFISLRDKRYVIKGRRLKRRDSLFSKMCSLGYNLLIKIIFKLSLWDIDFSLKIFPRNILDKIDIKAKGLFNSAEFYIKALSSGFEIKEVGVNYTDRKFGKSKNSSLHSIFQTVKEIIELYPHLKNSKYK